MRVIFFGSSDYCLPILESLHKKFNLVAVISRPESPIEQFATSQSVRAFTPKDKTELLSLKNDLDKLWPDLAIVADYGIIIPKEIFTIPRHQTLNIHFSKLPKYRGPSPVQYTILNGEKSAWITIILMDETMDTGDILWRQEVGPLDGSETTPDLYRKLFSIAAQELPGVIDKYSHKKLKLLKQLNSQATYTKSFTRQDGFIPWEILKCAIENSKPSIKAFNSWPLIKIIPKLEIGNWKLEITHALRAFTPWPGLWTEITPKLDQSDLPAEASAKEDQVQLKTKKRLKILKAHIEPFDSAQGKPTTHNSQLTTRSVPDLVQLEGKKPVTWKQFLEGHPNFSSV